MAQANLVVQRSTDFVGAFSPMRPSDSFSGTLPQMYNLGVPVASATTGIGASIASNAASNVVTISAQPDVPRVMQVAFAASWDGGNIVITGIDQFGNLQTDTIVAAAGSTVVGVKAFRIINSISKTAVGSTANAATVGPGSKLGLPVIPTSPTTVAGVLFVSGVNEAATWDLTNGTVLPGTNVPNGTRQYFALALI